MPDTGTDPAVITASDIARLAGMSRAAVSNWRRRYGDFPEPVGGTASSPTFDLDEIREWLHHHGKTVETAPTDRALEDLWHRIRRANTDDTVEQVAAIGGHLTGETPTPLPAELATEVDRVADLTSRVDTYTFLLDRIRQTVTNRPRPPATDLAAVAAAVLPDEPQDVYDPACGLAATFVELARHRRAPTALTGQDLSPQWIGLAGPLLGLLGLEHRLAAGDSVHHDAFPSHTADAAVCDIPVGTTDRQRDRLAHDTRLAFGIPPRAEPELLWVQLCLAHVKPGGPVVALMPAAAAYRRSGRRIRAELLRRGALIAVIAPDDGSSHIWILRRPETTAPPSQLFVAVGADIADPWRRYLEQPDRPVAEDRAVTVPLVTLLDDIVDVTPQTRIRQALRRPVADRFAEQTEELRTALVDLPEPSLHALSDPVPTPHVTVAELERQGALKIEPVRAEAPRVGDVVVCNGSDGPRAYVPTEPGAGYDGEYVVRCTEGELDPHWLAAALTAGMSDRPPTTTTGGAYVKQVRVPRLPLAEQAERGRWFREFADREQRLRRAADLAARLSVTAAEGLVTGGMAGET